MRRSLLSLLAVLLTLAPAALAQSGGSGGPPGSTGQVPPPVPVPKLVVQKPTAKGVLIREGQPNRLLLGGTWYFRLDDALQGEVARYFAQSSLSGWMAIHVPHNWNGADTTLNRQSVGWYRKEFKLPKGAKGSKHTRWKVRFESVNHHARVWLNGKEIGQGGPSFYPFELNLKGVRKGSNRLVVRVSSRRSKFDLSHWRFYGNGGWWNYGGLSREVYVRPLDTVDIEDMAVTPRLRRVNGAARILVRLRLRSVARKEHDIHLALRLRGKGKGGQLVELSPRKLKAGATREVNTSFLIKKPRLWRPGRPNLYRLTASAAVDGERRSSFLRAFGVRKIERLSDGRVLLNGRQLRLRGASVHEDELGTGDAVTPDQRKRIMRRLHQLHATIVRAHYPLHPAYLERFDRDGIMVWDEAPVYQLPNAFLDNPSVRRTAISAVRRMVLRDRSHPSVLSWSIGNELAYHASEGGRIGAGFERYVRDAAKAVREIDRTRLVVLDRQSRIGEAVSAPAFNTLDAIGVNEYFGWYSAAAAGLPKSKTSDLGPFLDQVHLALPHAGVFITEFGAEATGSGPDTEKGTYQFQQRFITDHLRIQASKPFVNGSIVWLLKDYRATAAWTGGNSATRSTPPWNNKGIIDQSGTPKPAFWALRDLFRRTRPLR